MKRILKPTERVLISANRYCRDENTYPNENTTVGKQPGRVFKRFSQCILLTTTRVNDSNTMYVANESTDVFLSETFVSYTPAALIAVICA